MNPPRIFNGCLTLTNKKSGEHRTFRIRTQKADARFAPGKRIIALLTGPDNTSSYTRFGFVDDRGIQVWSNKRGKSGGRSSYEWFAEMLWGAATDPTSKWARDYDLLIAGRCIRCNRLLTDPNSIRSGIGPVCVGY